MKASLKLKESHSYHNGEQKPVLRFKIPISILNLPFISTITTSDSHSSHLSFNLRTNSPSGPSLNLSYTPTTPTTTTTTTTTTPLSLTLKSGVGLFGSPNDSPLILSAHFNLFAGNPNPTFSLQLKPQFGQFSLKKTAISDSLPNPPKSNGAHHFSGDVMPERVRFRREFPELDVGRDGFLSGVAVMARTVLPVGRRTAVKFRWGVNFPPEFGECRSSLPFLTFDKVSVERVVEVEEERRGGHGGVGDLEALKGMCVWMRREVEDLKRENRELKESLEGLRLGDVRSNNGSQSSNVGGKAGTPSFGAKSGEFDRWRSKKSVREENGRGEAKKSGGFEVSKDDVGEELKKAIKAASINGA